MDRLNQSVPHARFNKNLCRVCGWDQGEPPWGEDGKTPTFGICDCCGVEFGYQDALPEAAAGFRDIWLAKGAPWRDQAKKSSNWDLSVQLARIGQN